MASEIGPYIFFSTEESEFEKGLELAYLKIAQLKGIPIFPELLTVIKKLLVKKQNLLEKN